MFRRLTIVCSILPFALLAACGTSSVDTTNAGAPAASTTPTPSGTSSALGLPSGIVTKKSDADATTITIYDLGTGTELARAVAPPEASITRRENFDPSMSRLAYTSNCAVRVASLQDGQYVMTNEWAPPAAAYGKQKPCFDSATFAADGTVHALTNTNGYSSHKYSVDPAKPLAPVRDVGPLPNPDNKAMYINNKQSESGAYVYTRGGEITKIRLSGSVTGELLDAYEYQCSERVDDVTLLCSATKLASKDYGSVAVARVDRKSEIVKVKQVAPQVPTDSASGSLRPAVPLLVSPDRASVAIQDRSGWYVTKLTNAEQTPARQGLSDATLAGEPLFWH